MRRANKVLLTMGSAMLISAGAAVAGPPAAYNGYSSASGTITATCPTGSFDSCGTAITGDGFFQRSVVIGGQTYFQTIVLPNGANVSNSADIANLAFADENFVKQGGGEGIADSQHLFAAGVSTNPGDFTADTLINSGWAQGTADSVIALTQSVVDTAVGFNLGFGLTGDGVNTTSVDVTQSVALDKTLALPDKQEFALHRLTATAAGTSVALPNSASVTWASGDVIQAVWMGQSVTAVATQVSGYQAYAVVAGSTTASVSYSDQTSTGPWSYDTTFGTAPTF